MSEMPAASGAPQADATAFRDPPKAANVLWDLAPGLLFLVALLLFGFRLGSPPRYMYDEVYHAYTAAEYVRGNPDAYVWNTTSPRRGVAYMWNHPPAGVLLIATGIRLWGDTSFGWRFASALFGAAGVVLLFTLALALTGDRRVALLAAALLMLDGLYFVQSRVGMLDIFGVVFMLGAFLALFRYLTGPPDRAFRPLLALGLLIGLAVATKWNAVYASALIAGVVTVRTVALGMAMRLGPARTPLRIARLGGLDPNDGFEDRARRAFARHLVAVPLALAVVPTLVYLAAYIPFFLTGHTFDQFVELQRQIYAYHTGLKATHTYRSSWWQWPLALRPVWYHVQYLKAGMANVYANVNPLLAWGFLPCVAWLATRWWRERPTALVVFLIGFFGQWLPWALVHRIAFSYHFLPSVPFGCVAVSLAASTAIRRGRAPRLLALVYLTAIAASFVFFFPIYAAVPLTWDEFAARIWLRSWR